MSEPARKPDLQEQLGVAVNASSLTLREAGETALLRVAAMGAAAACVTAGADVEGVPLAGASTVVYGTAPDRRDLIVGELAPMLCHILYGNQVDMVPRAIPLFADWIRHKAIFTGFAGAEHHDLRMAFAARVFHEWLSDRCASCAGSKKQQQSASGKWLRPMGNMQRNATFRPCTACMGTGRAPVRHPERTRALGITREQYDEQRWGQRFDAGLHWLTKLIPQRLTKALTVELERRKRRT